MNGLRGGYHSFPGFALHDLEEINILNNDGTLNANAGKFKGQDRYEARKNLITELEKKGFLEKVDKYDLSVGTAQIINASPLRPPK